MSLTNPTAVAVQDSRSTLQVTRIVGLQASSFSLFDRGEGPFSAVLEVLLTPDQYRQILEALSENQIPRPVPTVQIRSTSPGSQIGIKKTRSPEMNPRRCLKCENPIRPIPTWEEYSNLDHAGEMEVSFGYGSSHDMCHGHPHRKACTLDRYPKVKPERLSRLLASDRLLAYICDSCFTRHLDLFAGWDECDISKSGWKREV